MASAHTPVKNVCYSCGSPGYKPHWLLELGILGACPLGGVLRVVVVNCGVHVLHSSGRSWNWSSLLIIYCCAGGEVYVKHVSAFPTHFDAGMFWFYPTYRSRLGFLNFFQRKLLHVHLYIWYVHGRRGVQEPPMSSSLQPGLLMS